MNNFHDEIPDIDISDIVIPGVDAELGSSLCGGELDIFITGLRWFAANIPVAIERLRTVSAETLPLYATNVHGLKSSCAIIGAEEVRKKAYDLEMKSKAGDLGGVLAHNGTLLKETEQLIKDIQAWLNTQHLA
jgi:HPt (histidine-containing phosphotransfer) domain-containing protein